MEIEATQAIPLSDYEDESEVDQGDKEKKLVAHLKVAGHKDFPDTDFAIFEGENVLGREESCSIHIPLKSLSKEHAVIEVQAGQHFLIDKGSRNRTRRGKLYLKPEARYELRDADQVTFADVNCVYVRQDVEESPAKPDRSAAQCGKGDAGSDTGSESDLLFDENTGKKTGKPSEQSYMYEEDEDDDFSSDILQPTQPACGVSIAVSQACNANSPRKKVQISDMATVAAAAAFAEDTDDDETDDEQITCTPFAGNKAVIAETPAPSKSGIVPESPVEETQVYQEEEELDLATKRRIACEPTQAFMPAEEENVVKATQPYAMDTESTQTAEEVRKSRGKKPTATLAYDMDIEATQTAEEIRAKRQAQGSNGKPAKNAALLEDLDNAPTQTFSEDSDAENSRDGASILDLGTEGTMAFEYEEASDEEEGRISPYKQATSKKAKVTDLEEMETQVYDENEEEAPATVAVGRNIAMAETQAVDGTDTVAMAETQAVDGTDTVAMAETQAVDGTDNVAMAETQAVDGTDTVAMAETQAVGGTDTVAVSDTVALSDTVAVSDTVAMAETQVVGGDEAATQVFPSTEAAGDDATQLIPSEGATQVVETNTKAAGFNFKTPGRPAPKNAPLNNEDTQLFEATQVIEMAPPATGNKIQGRKKSPVPLEVQATQVFDTANGSTQAIEATQIIELTPEAASNNNTNKNKMAVSDQDATQIFDQTCDATQIFDDADAATQVFTAMKSPGNTTTSDTQILPSEVYTATQPANTTPVIRVNSKDKLEQKSSYESTPSLETQILGDTQTPELEVYEEGGKSEGFSPALSSTQVPVLRMELTPNSSMNSTRDGGGGTGKLAVHDEPTQMFGEDSFASSEPFTPGELPATGKLAQKASTTVADSPSPSKPSSDPQKRLFDNDEAATQAYALCSDTDSEPEEEASKGVIPNLTSTPAQKKSPKPNETDNKLVTKKPIKAKAEDSDATDSEDELLIPNVTKNEQGVAWNTDMEPTQAYAMEVVDKEEDNETDSDEDILVPKPEQIQQVAAVTPEQEKEDKDLPDGGERGSKHAVLASDLEPTQAYGLDAGSESDNELPIKNTDFMATQAYGGGDDKIIDSSQLEDDEELTSSLPMIGLNPETSLILPSIATEQPKNPSKDDDDMVAESEAKTSEPEKKSRRGKPVKASKESIFAKDKEDTESDNTSKRGRGRRSKVADSKESKADDPKPTEGKKDDVVEESTASTRHRGRQSKVQDINKGEAVGKATEDQKEEDIEETTSTRHRGRQSKLPEIKEDKAMDDDKEDTNKRTSRKTNNINLIKGRGKRKQESASAQNVEKIEETESKETEDAPEKLISKGKQEKQKEEEKTEEKIEESKDESPVKRGRGRKNVPQSEGKTNDNNAGRGKRKVEETKEEDVMMNEEETEEQDMPVKSQSPVRRGKRKTVVNIETKEEENKDIINEKNGIPSKRQRGRRGQETEDKEVEKKEEQDKIKENENKTEEEQKESKEDEKNEAPVHTGRGRRGKKSDESKVEEKKTAAKEEEQKELEEEKEAPTHKGRGRRGKQKEELKEEEKKSDTKEEEQKETEEEKEAPTQKGKGRRGKQKDSKEDQSESQQTNDVTSDTESERPRRGKGKQRKTINKNQRHEADTEDTEELAAAEPALESPKCSTRKGIVADETAAFNVSGYCTPTGTPSLVPIVKQQRNKRSVSPAASDVSTASSRRGQGRGRGRGRRGAKVAETETESECESVRSRSSRATKRNVTAKEEDTKEEETHLEPEVITANSGRGQGRGRGRRNTTTKVAETESECESSRSRSSRASRRTVTTKEEETHSESQSSQKGRATRGRVSKAVEEESKETEKKQRGKAVKEDSEEVEVIEETPSQPTTVRGRKTKKGVEKEDLPVSQESQSTRGRRGKAVTLTQETATEEEEEKVTSQSQDKKEEKKEEENSQTTKRGRRGRQSVKQKAATQTQETEDEAEKVTSQSQDKKEKTEQEENSQTTNRGRKRGRQSVKEVEKDEETDPTASSQTGRNRWRRGTKKEEEETSQVKEEVEEEDAAPSKSKRGARGKRAKKEESEDEKEEEVFQASSSKGGRKRGAASEISTADEGSQAKRGRASASAGAASSQHQQLSSSSQESSTESPSRPRRRTILRKPGVMFTGVVDNRGELTVKSLGGEMVSHMKDCTHLVTDQVRRTVKFLCGMAQGILIVGPEWLERSRDAATFLDATPFLIKDKESEKKFGFELTSSLQLVRETGPMLQGWKVHVTQGVKPQAAHMKEIIHSAGGEYISSLSKCRGENSVVVSCPEYVASLNNTSTPIVTAEFILTGILQHKIDLKAHALSAPSQGGGKKRGASGDDAPATATAKTATKRSKRR